MLGKAELPPNLVDEVRDVIADASRPVGAEVREVLAHLCRVDTGRLGQVARGDRGRASLRHLDQRAQVDGQPSDGGFGNRAVSHRARGAVTQGILSGEAPLHNRTSPGGFPPGGLL